MRSKSPSHDDPAKTELRQKRDALTGLVWHAEWDGIPKLDTELSKGGMEKYLIAAGGVGYQRARSLQCLID
jgi:hypothetical protein